MDEKIIGEIADKLIPNEQYLAKNNGMTDNDYIDGTVDDVFDNFKNRKKHVSLFKESMIKLISDNRKTQKGLVIVIDELDRCRPNYAIELLERIKHIFDLRSVIFVFGTDTLQLSESIKVLYGYNFNSNLYLGRFFYRQYKLDEPKNTNIVKVFVQQNEFLHSALCIPEIIVGFDGLDTGLDILTEFISRCFSYYHTTTREVLRSLEILKTIVELREKRIHLQILFLLPIIILEVKRVNDINQKTLIAEEYSTDFQIDFFMNISIGTKTKNGIRFSVLLRILLAHRYDNIHSYLSSFRNYGIQDRLSYQDFFFHSIFYREYQERSNEHSNPTKMITFLSEHERIVRQAGRLKTRSES